MAKGICSTCKFGKLDYPPTPGAADDGVDCSNPKMVDVIGSPEAKEEFDEYGSLNLWRVEVAEPGSSCPAWEGKDDEAKSIEELAEALARIILTGPNAQTGEAVQLAEAIMRELSVPP